MVDEVRLYTDGAARGNPGPAAAGFRVLSAAGELLSEHEETLGNRTNNQAEYTALILGLEACQAYTRGRVAVGSDSKLLVEQMSGVWRVKEPELRRLQAEAQDKAARFQNVQYRHYPRTHAEIAKVDQALNRLLDLDASGSSPRAAV
jgi:ribonuclease HI